jgi:pSer/pThr/pTyr-binding forkhead associated (FHA) protein
MTSSEAEDGPYADADTVADPGRRAPGSPRAWLWGEQGVAGEFLLASPLVTVGRDPGRSVVLGDLTISREHATLDYRDGGWWLLPGPTSNGTWLNGHLVQPGERVPVGDGDRLRFGPHTQLRMLMPPPLAEPVLRFVAATRITPGGENGNEDARLATERLLVVADGLSLDLVRLRRDEARGWRVEGAHIGDGQVLLQDSFGIRQVTRDGTVGGRPAAADPARAERLAADPEFGQLTSAAGFACPIDPDRWWMHADREQRLVLATGGLLSALGADGISAALRHSRADSPAGVADKLIRLAIEAGPSGNVTLIVADITGSGKCYRHRHREAG